MQEQHKQGIPILTLTVQAASPITEGRAVTYQCKQATTAGEKILGISMCNSDIGDAQGVVKMGTVLMVAGGPIKAGDPIMCDSTGCAVVNEYKESLTDQAHRTQINIDLVARQQQQEEKGCPHFNQENLDMYQANLKDNMDLFARFTIKAATCHTFADALQDAEPGEMVEVVLR